MFSLSRLIISILSQLILKMPLTARTLSSVLTPSALTTNDPVDPQTLSEARAVLSDVQSHGMSGLTKHAVRLGDLKTLEDSCVASKEEMKQAFEGMSKIDQGVLERTAERVRAFAAKQRACLSELDTEILGGRAGHSVAPVEVAGCYAPGGRYPLPSSVLMTAITARVAGVKTVVVASPRPQPVTLAAAYCAGADFFIKIGGAGGIGAMAYGCVPGIPACDVIVGPGNRWVTAAKQLVSGRCGIDMLAGPSECLVWCDDSCDPSVVAADLLAQAEHDADAIPILVASGPLAQKIVDDVQAEIEAQLQVLPTASTARLAVEGKGFYVVCKDKQEAADVCNALGPEHLEVITKDSVEDAKMLTRYGGLFIGPRSAEVFGDYGAGPNHVLPTSNTAKYTGGLSVFTFLRIRTWMKIEDELKSQELVEDAAHLARLEGLEGHARAAEKRRSAAVQGSPLKKAKN